MRQGFGLNIFSLSQNADLSTSLHLYKLGQTNIVVHVTHRQFLSCTDSSCHAQIVLSMNRQLLSCTDSSCHVQIVLATHRYCSSCHAKIVLAIYRQFFTCIDSSCHTDSLPCIDSIRMHIQIVSCTYIFGMHRQYCHAEIRQFLPCKESSGHQTISTSPLCTPANTSQNLFPRFSQSPGGPVDRFSQ